jgi:hypothetical protein
MGGVFTNTLSFGFFCQYCYVNDLWLDVDQGGTSSDRVVAKYGLLFTGYRGHVYWWKAVHLLIKVATSVFLVVSWEFPAIGLWALVSTHGA